MHPKYKRIFPRIMEQSRIKKLGSWNVSWIKTSLKKYSIAVIIFSLCHVNKKNKVETVKGITKKSEFGLCIFWF
jgi:hypothetical protein